MSLPSTSGDGSINLEDSWMKAHAKGDWSGEEWGEEYLSLNISELLNIRMGLEQGWAYGRSVSRGEEGWLPPSYVSLRIPIEVRNMIGDVLELEVDWTSPVSEIKTHVEEHWGIPVLCQKLIVCDTVVQDDTTVDSYCNDTSCIYIAGTLSMTVVASVEEAFARLGIQTDGTVVSLHNVLPFHGIRPMFYDEASVLALASMAMNGHGNERVTEALRQLLDRPWSGQWSIKQAAAVALAHIMPIGDQQLIGFLMELLDAHGARGFRDLDYAKLVEALAKTAPIEVAIPVLLQELQCFWKIQQQKMVVEQALNQLVQKGDAAALAVVIRHVQERANSRHHSAVAAITFLARISVKGDQRVIGVMLELLAEKSTPTPSHFPHIGCGSAVQAAFELLKKITPTCDERVVAAAIDYLEVGLHRAFKYCRRNKQEGIVTVSSCTAAISALAHFAPKHDSRSLNTFFTCLNHEHWEVRHAALKGIVQVAPQRDTNIISKVCELVQDLHMEVRRAAVGALANVAQKGDKDAIDAAITCLDDKHLQVHSAAVHTLAHVASNGDERVVDALLTLAQRCRSWTQFANLSISAERCSHVKGDLKMNQLLHQSTLATLSWLANKGNQRVISEAILALNDEQSAVQRAAVRVLEHVARPGDGCAIAALLLSVGREHKKVQELMSNTLSYLAPQGNESALTEAIACIERGSEVHCRQAAIELVGRIASEGDERILRILTMCLLDPIGQIRKVAAQAFLRLLPKPGRCAVQAAMAEAMKCHDDQHRDSFNTQCSQATTVDQSVVSLQGFGGCDVVAMLDSESEHEVI